MLDGNSNTEAHTGEVRLPPTPPHPTNPPRPIYLFIYFRFRGAEMPTPTSFTLYKERIGPCPCQYKGFVGPGGPVLGQEKLGPAVPGGPPKSSSLHFAFNGPHFLLGLSKELWARLWAQRVARAVLTVRPGTVSALKRETICVPEPSVSTSWHLMSADWAVAHLGTDQETGTH